MTSYCSSIFLIFLIFPKFRRSSPLRCQVTNEATRMPNLLNQMSSFALLVANRTCTKKLQQHRSKILFRRLSEKFCFDLYTSNYDSNFWLKKVNSIKKPPICKAESFTKSKIKFWPKLNMENSFYTKSLLLHKIFIFTTLAQLT